MIQRHVVHTDRGTHEFLIDESEGDSMSIVNDCAIASQGGILVIVPLGPRDYVEVSFQDM
jgi:hypothetical protein